MLIFDSLRAHLSKVIKAGVAERQDQIELFYLTSYSPQLNQGERLNTDLKREIGMRVSIEKTTRLREAPNHHMTTLEHNPKRANPLLPEWAGSTCGLKPHRAVALTRDPPLIDLQS